MTPLTSQEEGVRNILLDRLLPFESHHVFDLDRLGRLSVDFLVFVGPGIVLECTACSTKRGRALSEVRRRASFLEYRFGLLKRTFPKIVCGALVEAPKEDQGILANELKQILRTSNLIARTNQELDEVLSGFIGGGRT